MLSPSVDKSVDIPFPIWDKLKEHLKTQVSRLDFIKWFEPVTSGEVREDHVVLSVPNKFTAEWIQDHYKELLEQEAGKLAERTVQLRFAVSEATTVGEAPTNGNGHMRTAPEEGDAKPFVGGQTITRERVSTLLNPKYTFENFVVGSGTSLAHAACQSVAKLPGGHYNPLYLYGGVGLGKTHLLHAVGIEILKKFPHFKIVYVSAERFMNEFINSVRNDRMNLFRQKYRESCDMLLVDDVQFLGGKESTQHEFFHTFNIHYDSQRQIILTSDKIPKEIPGLEERLRSRFEWGLIADVQPPDLETRAAILRKKAESDRIPLTNEVAMYIAHEIKSNVRELEGALIRLNAFSALTKAPLTIELAREVFKNQFANQPANTKKRTTAEEIQQTVAEYYQIALHELNSPRRVREYAYPRQIAMYLCKKYLHLSFPEIGHKFGGKDHTTVLHACRKIERLLEQDSGLQNDVSILEKTIL